MDKNKKRILIYAGIILFLLMPFLIFNYSHADSGWDSGYDSGGSSSGGGGIDIGGSSSYGDGDGHLCPEEGCTIIDYFFFALMFACIGVPLIFVIYSMFLIPEIRQEEIQKRTDIPESEIKKYLPDYSLGSLKHVIYQNFVRIQVAWMNFNYDTLRELCTDELYNTYRTQLEVLRAKNQQNIMSHFILKEIRINGISASEKIISVSVYLRVAFFDYVVTKPSNRIVYGTYNSRITNNYNMTFVISKDRKPFNKCPICGAPIDANTSVECGYCRSTLVYDSKELVLSKKMNERTER